MKWWQRFKGRRARRGWTDVRDLRDISDPKWESQKFHTHRHVCGKPTTTSRGEGAAHTHFCVCAQVIPFDDHGFPWDEGAHRGRVKR